MKYEKQIIDDIFKCYAVHSLHIGGCSHLVFAAEGDGGCHVFSGKDFRTKQTLWEGGGGTMSIVPVPEKEGYFFASRGFYSMVEATTAHVVLVRYGDGGFKAEKIMEIPYLHRFDILNANGKRYFLGASLCSAKKSKKDWSSPGKLFVSAIPEDLDGEMDIEVEVLKEGLTKNHGYGRGVWNEKEAGFIGCEEGLLAVTPPQSEDDSWKIEQILDQPVSDVAVIDIDGDGEIEFAVIEPFHGDKFAIYKKIDGVYQEVYAYPTYMDFYHAVFAATLNGIPAIIGGARRGAQQLFAVWYDKGHKRYENIVLDEKAGPSNVNIINTQQGDIVMSANREIGQAAIYKFGQSIDTQLQN